MREMKVRLREISGSQGGEDEDIVLGYDTV
jgi:hypothetical protein